MPGRPPDRKLRLAVSELEAMSADDFDAVLASLDPDQRSRVIALLAELQGDVHVNEIVTHNAPAGDVILPDDLSPWLAARINGRMAGDGTDEPFSVTAAAQVALRRCATELMPQPHPLVRSESLAARFAARLGMGAV